MFSSTESLLVDINFKVLSIVCSLILIYKIFQKYYKYRTITSKITTFYGLPLVGTFVHVLPMKKFLYKLGGYFDKSLTFFTWLGVEPLILTIDPQIIKHILNSEEFLNKATVLYKSLDHALPSGLITSKFFKWKHNRKLMNTSFTGQILQRFTPIFLRSTEKIAQHFESLQEETEHSIFPFVQKSIMEIALETIMGLEPNANQNLSAQMVANIHTLMEKICVETVLSPMKLGFLVRNSTYFKILKYLETFLKNLISRKPSIPSNDEGNEIFLNRALKYQQQGLFSSEETFTEIYTMISASHETTSTTLYSLIVMLAMHPDVQEKLYQDVIKILPNTEQITYDHLEQLPYLNMILSETLRLVPPLPFIGREALESCNLTEEVSVPRDFQVLISLFHLHRCKTFWGPNADKFNPDNFLTTEIEKRHPYAYVPYSKGVRNCIGLNRLLNKIILWES